VDGDDGRGVEVIALVPLPIRQFDPLGSFLAIVVLPGQHPNGILAQPPTGVGGVGGVGFGFGFGFGRGRGL
jgi:hypothetical protein